MSRKDSLDQGITGVEFDQDDCVTIRCNKCGEEYGFFPLRVVYLRECRCGNNDWGRAKEWVNNKFGNFTSVKREKLVFTNIMPWEQVP